MCRDPAVRALYKDLYPIDLNFTIQTYRVLPSDMQMCALDGLFEPIAVSALSFSGFHVFSDFFSEEEEGELVNSLDPYPWVDS